MQYSVDASPVRSLDVASTETANRRRYRHANAQVLINPQGKPVAFRRIRVLQPGSFAGGSQVQIVTPRRTSSLDRSVFDAYKARCHPLN